MMYIDMYTDLESWAKPKRIYSNDVSLFDELIKWPLDNYIIKLHYETRIYILDKSTE